MFWIVYTLHLQFFNGHLLLYSGAFLTHSGKPSQITLILLVINHRGRGKKKKKEKSGYIDTVQPCASLALYLTGIDFLDKYFYPHITLPFCKLVPGFVK